MKSALRPTYKSVGLRTSPQHVVQNDTSMHAPIRENKSNVQLNDGPGFDMEDCTGREEDRVVEETTDLVEGKFMELDGGDERAEDVMLRNEAVVLTAKPDALLEVAELVERGVDVVGIEVIVVLDANGVGDKSLPDDDKIWPLIDKLLRTNGAGDEMLKDDERAVPLVVWNEFVE